jgi:hypothetical protein
LKWLLPATTLYNKSVNVKRLLKCLPIPLFLALAAAPSLGQETTATGIHCIVYTIQDLSPGSDTAEYQQSITDAVAAAASARGYTVLPGSAWKDAALSRSLDPDHIIKEAPALEIARIAGAEIAITGFFSVENDEIYYSLQCWDAATNALIIGVQETTLFNLAFFSALGLTLTNDFFPAVQRAQKPGPRLSFTSPDEGMEVLLSGDTSIGRITDGRVSWPIGTLSPGTKIMVEKRKKGYHAAQQTVTLRTDKDIPLTPLAKEHAAALELDMTFGQLLGLGLTTRGYAVPDWLFMYAGSYLWAQPPVVFAPRLIVHNDFSVGLGGYLFLPPGAPIRMGISSGIGCTVSVMSVPNLPLYSDFYLNVASWWLEAGFPGTTLFFQQAFRYALGLGTNLLGQGWLTDLAPVITLGVLFRW